MTNQLEKCKYADKYQGKRAPVCGCKTCIEIYADVRHEEGYKDGWDEGTFAGYENGYRDAKKGRGRESD